MLKKDPVSYIILLGSSALFATGYIIARAIDPAGGMDMFVTQAMLAGAIMLTVMKRRSKKPFGRRHIAPILVNGVGTPVIVFLVLEGSRVITPSLAAIIVISNALLIALFTWALGRKRFTTTQTAALVTGFLGVVWISMERGALGGEWRGVLFLLAASALIAAVTVALENTVIETGGMLATRWIFWTAFASCAFWVIFISGVRFYSIEQTGLALALGVFGMGAPVLMFNVGMGRIGAADAAAFKLLIPLFALIYGFLLIGETPTVSSGLAGLVVISSVGVYQYKSSRAGGPR